MATRPGTPYARSSRVHQGLEPSPETCGRSVQRVPRTSPPPMTEESLGNVLDDLGPTRVRVEWRPVERRSQRDTSLPGSSFQAEHGGWQVPRVVSRKPKPAFTSAVHSGPMSAMHTRRGCSSRARPRETCSARSRGAAIQRHRCHEGAALVDVGCHLEERSVLPEPVSDDTRASAPDPPAGWSTGSRRH